MALTLTVRSSSMAALGAVALAIAHVGCSADHPQPSPGTREPVAAHVETLRLGTATSGVEVGGLVQPRTGAVVTSRLLAPVRQVHVAPGDRVRQGQVLVTLDDRDLRAQARGAATGATAAEDGRAALQAEHRAALAALDLATASHGRIAALHQRKSATAQEFDEARAGLRAAEARVAAVVARTREADAAIDRARAAREAADVTASFATITAPFAGVVTEKLIEPGNMAMPGTPLVRLEDTRGYTLDVRLDAAAIAEIAVGAPLEVVVDAGRPLHTTGHVMEVSRAMQADGRTFLVRVELPDDPLLRAGMSGRVRVPGTEVERLTVPVSAIQRTGQVTSVFVVDGDVARRRMVALGPAVTGGRQEVVSGLADGERVVTAPPPTLVDGAPVRAGER